MDAREAREHLEMVDRILADASQRPVRIIPGLVIVWGFAAAAIDVGGQLYISHAGGNAGQWLAEAALALGILYSIALSVTLMRGKRFHRVSRFEQAMGRTMGAVWLTVIVAAFAQPHVFAAWGGAAVWSMGAAIMMLMSGFSGDRRGLSGGLILLASVLAANYATPQTPGYMLGAGFIFGYAVPGLLFLTNEPCAEA
jgi:hypothetical protein